MMSVVEVSVDDCNHRQRSKVVESVPEVQTIAQTDYAS